MMSWLEIKYLERMKFQLEKYEQVSSSPFVANFKCPLCGDSKRRISKKRAYVYEKDVKFNYYCHNCGASMAFHNFLEMQNPKLYGDYKLEWMKSMGYMPKSEKKPDDEKRFNTHVHFDDRLNLGKKLSVCSDDDPVLQYVKGRMIPEQFWSSLYSCPNIQSIVDQVPRYKDTQLRPDPCLVIPFFNENREYSYIVLRSINPNNSFRYLVLEINDELPKLWGLERVDWSKPVYVFEGAIDAMCVPNSLALGGSVGISAIDHIIKHINNRSRVCFVYDNEIFSNHQILKQVKKRIKEGFSVVLYDRNFPSKDINEVICNEQMNFNSVAVYLQKRTFCGLSALLEIARLSKPHR